MSRLTSSIEQGEEPLSSLGYSMGSFMMADQKLIALQAALAKESHATNMVLSAGFALLLMIVLIMVVSLQRF